MSTNVVMSISDKKVEEDKHYLGSAITEDKSEIVKTDHVPKSADRINDFAKLFSGVLYVKVSF